MRGRASGASVAVGSLRLGEAGALAISGAASGVSATAARLRLNGEVNVNLEGASAGSSSLGASLVSRLAGLAARSDGRASAVGSLSVARAEEFGFTVFVDGLDSALATALDKNIRWYTARLIASGTPVPIIRAEISAPPDRLSTELTVVLARPDMAAIAFSDEVDFEIGVWTGEGFDYLTLLEGARLSGRGAHYANEAIRPTSAPSSSACRT